MKKLILIICLSFSLIVNAQTITYSNFIQVVSDTSQVKVANLSSYNLAWNTTIGQGITWNASTLVPDPAYPLIHFTFHDPSSTSYGSLYSQSNYARLDPDLLAFIEVEYINISSDSLVLNGSYAASGEHEIFQNPDKSLIFPFEYNQSFTDSYYKTNYSDATTISSYQSGNRSVSYNGFGTLLLPSGTFNNVALVSEIRTNNLGPNSFTYSWYDISNGKTLMRYHQNGNSISAIYTPENPVVTGIPDINTETVALFPNPASEKVYIQGLTKGSLIRISDLTSKTVYLAAAGIENETIDVSDFPMGLYFVSIYSKKGTSTKKLIVAK